MEPSYDRISKRLSEINEQQAALERDDAERHATDNDRAGAVVDRRNAGPLRSAVFLVLLIAIAAGLFGVAVTLTRLAGKDFGDAQRQGTAQVTSCVQHGPISNKGFGYWDRCTASIGWDDGASDRVTVSAVFQSSDIGAAVRVGDLGAHRTSKELARAGAAHRPWLAWIGYAVSAIAFVPALVAVLTVRELLSFGRRR